MKTFLIIISLPILMFSGLSYAQTYTYVCPDPDFAMLPEVDAKVNFDKKTGLYTYKYKIKNKSEALVPIR